MDSTQTAKMVAWLDEERRKDKALITKLEERASAQTALIEDQSRRIQAMEAELTNVRTSGISVSRFDEAIGRLRADFNASLEQFESRRGNVEQDLKKIRDTDRDAVMKVVEELRQETTTRIDRAVQPRKAEEERLAKVAAELQTYADNLSKSFEEFQRTLGYLEEQRRQDTRRISDVNSDVAEVAKRAESQQAKLELLEDLSRRNERQLTELSGLLSEFKQQRLEWSEQQALIEQQREQTMNEMLRRMDGFGEDMAGFAKQVEVWADTHREMKKQIGDFERLADRIDRRLNEVSEMQRLSEERFRQEWEEYLTDDQKRWRQFTITNEEAWRTNERTIDEIKSLLTQLGERSERQVEHLKLTAKVQADVMTALMNQLRALSETAEEARKTLPSLTT
jgi:chromosome segregation ATPase